MIKFTIDFVAKGPVIHPFLFTIYPILFLWGSNRAELSRYASTADLLLPMAISIGITLFLLVGLGLLLKSWRQAGVLAAFFLLLFFSYGHVQTAIADIGQFGYPKHRFLGTVWAVIFVVGCLLLLWMRFRRRSDFRNITIVLNIVGFVLVIFALPNVVWYRLPSSAIPAQDGATKFVGDVPNRGVAGTRPDIFYITTEAYGSSTVLKEFRGFDNSQFISYLKRKGFYVVSQSNSNYANTAMSQASSLNMEHVNHFTPETHPGGTYAYYGMSIDSKVMRFARDHGYRIVHMREWYVPKNAASLGDLYYGCERGGRVALHADEFAGALLHTTALEPILRKFALLEFQQADLRSCEFSQLVKAKDLDGPKLVFIHLLVPGEPYVVRRDIGALDDGYLEQMVYTNKELQWVFDSLLSDPDYSPVIVLQGDHGEDIGTQTKEELYRVKMGIINAYHLPDGGNSLLYPWITPVNTFRVIFNYYLGANFQLLEDRVYYTDGRQGSYNFVDVTDVVRQAPVD